MPCSAQTQDGPHVRWPSHGLLLRVGHGATSSAARKGVVQVPNDREKQARIAIGVALYREDQWDLLRMLSEDGAETEESYEEWEAWLRCKLAELESGGHKIHRIDIDVRDLVAWCRREGVPLDGDARARHCALRVSEIDPGPEDSPSTGRRRRPKRR